MGLGPTSASGEAAIDKVRVFEGQVLGRAVALDLDDHLVGLSREGCDDVELDRFGRAETNGKAVSGGQP